MSVSVVVIAAIECLTGGHNRSRLSPLRSGCGSSGLSGSALLRIDLRSGSVRGLLSIYGRGGSGSICLSHNPLPGLHLAFGKYIIGKVRATSRLAN